MKTIQFNNKTITPSKVVCIGRNYVEHIKELDNETPSEPVIFCKPNSAISDEIDLDKNDEIHYEGEICFVVVNNQLAGVGFGLDLTKREVQSKLKTKGLPWERAKAFDGSAVLSDFVEFDGNTQNIHMQLLIDGELKQYGGYDLMLYKPQQILEEIIRFMTLEDGDVIMTGTPKGVGKIQRNTQFTGRIFQGETLLVENNCPVK
ncbi:MAG: fumarylacetoacetate hydrolase family protein [Xanthomonadales bacterium]|nr:fumarylacetoacetate hydrolase family protein [Xanthomonadales bacterium]